VARRDIISLLDRQVTSSRGRLGELTQTFYEGKIDRSVWLEQMRDEIKNAHLTNRALGKGGFDRLGFSDYGSVGGRLHADYRRLESFADDIANGDISIAQALNRSNMYAGNARIQYWEASRSTLVAGPGEMMIEKRNLNPGETCEDCLNYHNQGWQLAAVLPSPGISSACMSNCNCDLESRIIPASEADQWIGTRR